MTFLERIESMVPIEHFNGDWSIQTEQTHGQKGVVKVSKTKLEDSDLAPSDQPDRMSGGEDIFRGTKDGVEEYVRSRYPGNRVEFVSAAIKPTKPKKNRSIQHPAKPAKPAKPFRTTKPFKPTKPNDPDEPEEATGAKGTKDKQQITFAKLRMLVPKIHSFLSKTDPLQHGGDTWNQFFHDIGPEIIAYLLWDMNEISQQEIRPLVRTLTKRVKGK